LFGAVAITALSLSTVAAAGDPEAGARAFRGCAACHSLAAGRHMTGPSLAGMWGRKAGTAEGFTRYSEAMVSSGVTWDAKTLDAWLENPAGFIPGNRMTFPGIADGKARADVIAYLEGAAAAEPPPGAPATAGGMANLRALGPEHQVTAIAHCGDTYRVTTAAGDAPAFGHDGRPRLRGLRLARGDRRDDRVEMSRGRPRAAASPGRR
jgi:cytochrome c